MSTRTAEASVRTAWRADARAIAAVQVASWKPLFSDLLPADVVDAMDVDVFAARWSSSLYRPEDARNRVLVALGDGVIRGFAVTGPGADPDADPIADGELSELVVDPDHRRQGHGSRLLQAAVETMRADRFTRATAWLASTDDAARRFVTDAGWAPDGAHRELDLHGDGTVRVKQVRLHTDLTEAA